jgi:hypothetical protein
MFSATSCPMSRWRDYPGSRSPGRGLAVLVADAQPGGLDRDVDRQLGDPRRARICHRSPAWAYRRSSPRSWRPAYVRRTTCSASARKRALNAVALRVLNGVARQCSLEIGFARLGRWILRVRRSLSAWARIATRELRRARNAVLRAAGLRDETGERARHGLAPGCRHRVLPRGDARYGCTSRPSTRRPCDPTGRRCLLRCHRAQLVPRVGTHSFRPVRRGGWTEHMHAGCPNCTSGPASSAASRSLDRLDVACERGAGHRAQACAAPLIRVVSRSMRMTTDWPRPASGHRRCGT